jgi:uncharacterized Fe-S radical SAM superfamily protein PflX
VFVGLENHRFRIEEKKSEKGICKIIEQGKYSRPEEHAIESN